MEKDLLINFLQWIAYENFTYSKKYKLWQKKYINETEFFSEYDLYLAFKNRITNEN
jgi:hypothetical protein